MHALHKCKHIVGPNDVHLERSDCTWNPYEKDLRITAARAFAAFKKAIQNLKTYYESELTIQLLQIQQNPKFPYNNKCDYKDGDAIVHFRYESQSINM